MNGAQKRTKHIWKGLRGKKYRYLTIAILCVSLIMAASMLMLYLGGQKDERRYQSESYEMLEQNTTDFNKIFGRADGFVRNLTASLGSLDWFASASQEEIDACFPAHIADAGIQWIRDVKSIDSPVGREFYNRIGVVLSSSVDFDRLILYAPNSGFAFGTISGGEYFFLARNEKELKRVFNTDVRWQTAQSGSLVFIPGATEEEHELLYIVEHLENGVTLLIGISDKSLMETLFANRAHRSYKLEQMVVHLPNGGLGYRDEQKKVTFIGRTWDVLTNRNEVFESNTYLMMRYRSASPAYTLIAILSPTGTGSVVSATLFMPFVVINVLWLLLVSFICVYVLTHFNRPIEEILHEIGTMQGGGENLSEVEQLAMIETAIHQYNQDLKAGQEDVEEQRSQLKRIYLGKLALDQNTYLSDQQLETLHIPQLLARYMLIVLYPDNGRWTHAEEGSEQEQAYQRHITILSVQEAMRSNMLLSGAEYLTCHTRLLIVVPVDENTDEQQLHDKAVSSAKSIGANLGMRLQVGFSKVYSDRSTFSRAYREALKRVTLVEGGENQPTGEVNFSELLKKNMRIADLIYIERYSGAFEAFKEIVHEIFRQPSGSMRTQQLQSFQTLMVCMLTETNDVNARLLEQMDAELDKMMQSENEEYVLECWNVIYKRLEENKSHKKISQYTEQFAAVYQYMITHFHDPALSLSMLSAEFGMSMSTLSREFQKNIGKGFLETLHQMRIEEARAEIENTELSLNQIAEAVGYTNVLTMTRAFKKYYGQTPGSFRKMPENTNE